MDSGGVYNCRKCQNPLALANYFVSGNYKAKAGDDAYLFLHAMNVVLGAKYEKQLITGVYSIADIHCSNCREELGWIYVQTNDPNQKFKEGKFVIEKLKLIHQPILAFA